MRTYTGAYIPDLVADEYSDHEPIRVISGSVSPARSGLSSICPVRPFLFPKDVSTHQTRIPGYYSTKRLPTMFMAGGWTLTHSCLI